MATKNEETPTMRGRIVCQLSIPFPLESVESVLFAADKVTVHCDILFTYAWFVLHVQFLRTKKSLSVNGKWHVGKNSTPMQQNMRMR